MHSEQEKAIEFVRAYTLQRKPGALQTLHTVCDRSNVPVDTIDKVIGNIQRNARIGIHFHPDRLDGSGKTIAASLLEDGMYQSQFETHVSSGALSPTAGGSRAQWEDRLFGDAFTGSDLSLRPKYGSLSLLGDPYGPSPRFGSCHFLLKPGCLKMATFCYGDSQGNPAERGTWGALEDILAILFKDSFVNEQALGRHGLRPPALFAHLQGDLSAPSNALADSTAHPNLNHYIEAQIHGEIRLGEAVDSLVADPSFQGTPAGETLADLGRAYGIPLRWHPGLQIPADDVPGDHRGGEMPAVAAKIAEDGVIHAELIGRAALDAQKNPQGWEGFAAPPSRLLKYLWHVLLRFGTEPGRAE
jgi:hypothetical protein